MATIRNSIALEDRMTSTLSSIVRALDSTMQAMRRVNPDEFGQEMQQAAMDIKRAELEVERLNNSLGETHHQVVKAGDGFTVMKGLAVQAITTVVGMVRGQLNAAFARIDTMENFERTMTRMTGSAENASKSLSELREYVVGTAYGLDVAAKTTQGFYTATRDLELSTKMFGQLTDVVTGLSDGTNQAMMDVAYTVQRILSIGKVSEQELQSLAGRLTGIREYVGEENIAMLKNVQGAGVEFVQLMLDAATQGANGLEGVAGTAREAGASWAATFDNMSAAITRGLVRTVETIDEILIAEGFGDIRSNIKAFGQELEQILISIARAIAFIGQHIDTLLPIAAGFFTTWIAYSAQAKIATLGKELRVRSLGQALATTKVQAALLFGVFGLGIGMMTSSNQVMKIAGGVLTTLAVAIGVAKISMIALGKATVFAFPVLLPAAIAAAGAAIVIFGIQASQAEKEIKAVNNQYSALVENTNKMQTAYQQTKSQIASQTTDWDKNALAVELNIKRLYELDKMYGALAPNSFEFQQIQKDLMGILPGITQYIYNETGAYSLQKGVIDELAVSYINLARAKSQEQAYTNLTAAAYETIIEAGKPYGGEQELRDLYATASKFWENRDGEVWGKIVYGETSPINVNEWRELSDTFAALNEAYQDLDYYESGMEDLLRAIADNTKVLADYGIQVESGFPIETNATVKNKISIKEEDLRMLNDLATRRYQINYQQLTPQMSINIDTVRETADIDEIVHLFEEGFTQLSNGDLTIPEVIVA